MRKYGKELNMVLKRSNKGIKDDPQFSPYYPSFHYIIFYDYGHQSHLGSKIFRTKKEAEAWLFERKEIKSPIDVFPPRINPLKEAASPPRLTRLQRLRAGLRGAARRAGPAVWRGTKKFVRMAPHAAAAYAVPGYAAVAGKKIYDIYREENPFAGMGDVKDANKKLGHHFFSRGTMQFFKSKIVSCLIMGKYFITKETNPAGVTAYTVREAEDSGNIKTVGEFHSFPSKRAAEKYIYTLPNPRKKNPHEGWEPYDAFPSKEMAEGYAKDLRKTYPRTSIKVKYSPADGGDRNPWVIFLFGWYNNPLRTEKIPSRGYRGGYREVTSFEMTPEDAKTAFKRKISREEMAALYGDKYTSAMLESRRTALLPPLRTFKDPAFRGAPSDPASELRTRYGLAPSSIARTFEAASSLKPGERGYPTDAQLSAAKKWLKQSMKKNPLDRKETASTLKAVNDVLRQAREEKSEVKRAHLVGFARGLKALARSRGKMSAGASAAFNRTALKTYNWMRKNPPSKSGPTLIYGKTDSITMQKTNGPYKGQYFEHKFTTRPEQHGIPRGTVVIFPGGKKFKIDTRSVLMTGKKDLWRNFRA